MKSVHVWARGTGILAASALLGVSAVGLPPAGAASHPASTAITVPMPPMSTLDPAENSVSIQLDQGVILEGLYGYNLKNHLEAKVAQSYKVTDGGKVWTFYLRKNARWSNGKPVTAQDFYYAWMRLDSPKDLTGAIWQGVMTYVQGAGAYHAGQIPASEVGLKVINPYELQVTLTAPHNILGILASAGSMPLYPPDVKQHGAQWFMPKYFVGDGPYVVKSFTLNGNVVLTRNKDYVGHPGEYNVGNVSQITVVPTPTVPVEDYLAGKFSAVWVTNPADYRYILSHPSLKAQVHKAPQYAVTTLEWDRSPTPSPLDNVAVRRAIAMAINRTPIVKDVMVGMAGGTSVFGAPGWAPAKYEHGLPFNVAEARKLLKQAGYPGGKGIPELYLYTQTTAANPTQVSVAEALAQEFKSELGIRFKIVPEASTLVNNIVYNGLELGVNPGYVIGFGNAGWIDAQYLPLKANQVVHYDGALANDKVRQYALTNWYTTTYDPHDVKLFGNPNDASMGTEWSQWKPLITAAKHDISWLAAWTQRQPQWYQEMVKPAPGQSNQDIWNGLVAQWHKAKTAAAKHQVWKTAWLFIGTQFEGDGNAAYGLNAQVYTIQHQGSLLNQLDLEEQHMQELASAKAANQLTGKMVDQIMNQGWVEPIFYSDSIYLAQPNLQNLIANPYGWTWWNSLQYVNVK